MKFCTGCGTELQDDAAYCTKCGCEAYQCQSQYIDKTHAYKRQLLNRKSIIVVISISLCIILIATICLKLMPYKSFDIKDDELIDILNECGAYASRAPLEVDGFDPSTTIYRITCEDETGLLVLSHSFSGYIRCIMVCFEDNDVYAAAIISSIASELDYSFSSSKAMNSLLWGDDAYSSNKYTAAIKALSSDLTGVFLAPTKHFEYCVKSVLTT